MKTEDVNEFISNDVRLSTPVREKGLRPGSLSTHLWSFFGGDAETRCEYSCCAWTCLQNWLLIHDDIEDGVWNSVAVIRAYIKKHGIPDGN